MKRGLIYGIIFLSLTNLSATSKLAFLISEYQAGNYEKARKGLEELLYPLQLTEVDEIALARLYLGFCYVMKHQFKEAREEFREVLSLGKENIFTPGLVSPLIREVFKEAKAEFEAIRQAEKRKALTGEIKYWERNLWVPLGIPELKRNEKVKGWSLLTVEALSVSVSILAYLLNSPDSTIKDYPDFKRARRLQFIQRITAVVFSVTYLYSVIDKFLKLRRLKKKLQ